MFGKKKLKKQLLEAQKALTTSFVLQEPTKDIDTTKTQLVIKSGEWLERYVELIFKLSGFKTERNKLIKRGTFFKKDVTHEIDVFVNLGYIEKPILIECKDVQSFNKSYVDTFFGKSADINHSGLLMATTNLKEEELKKYKDYCKRRGMSFIDGNELDLLVFKLGKINDIENRKKYLMRLLRV